MISDQSAQPDFLLVRPITIALITTFFGTRLGIYVDYSQVNVSEADLY